jgi:hypothetical protein
MEGTIVTSACINCTKCFAARSPLTIINIAGELEMICQECQHRRNTMCEICELSLKIKNCGKNTKIQTECMGIMYVLCCVNKHNALATMYVTACQNHLISGQKFIKEIFSPFLNFNIAVKNFCLGQILNFGYALNDSFICSVCNNTENLHTVGCDSDAHVLTVCNTCITARVVCNVCGKENINYTNKIIVKKNESEHSVHYGRVCTDCAKEEEIIIKNNRTNSIIKIKSMEVCTIQNVVTIMEVITYSKILEFKILLKHIETTKLKYGYINKFANSLATTLGRTIGRLIGSDIALNI